MDVDYCVVDCIVMDIHSACQQVVQTKSLRTRSVQADLKQ